MECPSQINLTCSNVGSRLSTDNKRDIILGLFSFERFCLQQYLPRNILLNNISEEILPQTRFLLRDNISSEIFLEILSRSSLIVSFLERRTSWIFFERFHYLVNAQKDIGSSKICQYYARRKNVYARSLRRNMVTYERDFCLLMCMCTSFTEFSQKWTREIS